MAGQVDTLSADDERYEAMFAVEGEMANAGLDADRDYTKALNGLRGKQPVMAGHPRTLVRAPQLREHWSVQREHWTFLSYRANEIGFRENLLFSSEGYKESSGVGTIGPTLLAMVGKKHKRYRSAVQKLFKRPRVLSWWRPHWIDEMVDQLLDRLEGREAVDLNPELCARLPMHVVTRAIGLSEDDALTFRYHLGRGTFGAARLPPEEAAASREFVDTTLRALVAERTRVPQDDVVSALLEDDLKLEDGTTRKLNEDELFAYCKLMIFAGGGTTWRQLGITIDALMTHYEFWEACREDRGLIEQAVEESLRWRATDPFFPRVSTAESEVEGVVVPEGVRVWMCLGTANHDPKVFENPERYDIFRDNRHNMGFGFGPHRCLGMDVAKQEMVVAINGLLDRFPNMRLDPSKPKPQFRGLDHRGMSAVPVLLK